MASTISHPGGPFFCTVCGQQEGDVCRKPLECPHRAKGSPDHIKNAAGITLAALLTASLAGCFPGSEVTASLPDVPADVRGCFVQLVPAPPAGVLTQKDIVKLVADLRTSEAAKSACGKRLLAFYDAEREGLK